MKGVRYEVLLQQLISVDQEVSRWKRKKPIKIEWKVNFLRSGPLILASFTLFASDLLIWCEIELTNFLNIFHYILWIWWWDSNSRALPSGVIVPVWVPFMGRVDLFKSVWILWQHVQKTSLTQKMWIWTYNEGGARGVMVIVVGNGHGDTSSNPGRDWLHFT